jgi:hypothetical protein
MGKPLSQFEVYPLPFASASTKSELKLELQPPHVRFTPNSRHSWRATHVRFGPISDICSAANCSLFDHLVGEAEQTRGWH